LLKTRRTSLSKFAYAKLGLWLLTLWVVTSCASFMPGPRLEDLNQRMTTLLGVIGRASPGGILKRGANNRSFYSHYHPPGGDPFKDASRSQKRAQSVVHLLNRRRPYTIVVQYFIEERFNGKYHVIKMDEKQARKIRDAIDTDLASRPDAPDFIDDFRPF